jgi:hypothetical protein
VKSKKEGQNKKTRKSAMVRIKKLSIKLLRRKNKNKIDNPIDKLYIEIYTQIYNNICLIFYI